MTKVYASGGRLVADPARPRIMVPADLKPLVEAHLDLLRRTVHLDEIPRRTKAFRDQLVAWSRSGQAGNVVPTLILPGAPGPQSGHCISCGVTVSRRRWRCDTCRIAVLDALSHERTLPRYGS